MVCFSQALGESQAGGQPPQGGHAHQQQHGGPQAPPTTIVQSDLSRTTGRDFFSNISSDLNGIAAQTTNLFSDFFGKCSTVILFLSVI